MKAYFQQKLKKGGFVRNVLTLMTGSTISQLIPIAISPLLTRLYSPTDFGTFALFLSLSSTIAVIAAGRYELAIMLPRKHEDAFQLLALCFIITIALSMLFFIPFSLCNQIAANLFDDPQIAGWLYLVPFLILFTGFFQTLNYWSNRKKQYERMAMSRVAQTLAFAGVSLSVGFLKPGPSGLILGGIFGQMLAVVVLGWQNWREEIQRAGQLSKNKIQSLAKQYQDFPKINSLHAFIDMLQMNGIVFIISAFFGSIILGYYSLTMRVLKAPLNFIGKTVAQVFYQKASEIYNEGGDLQLVVKRTIYRLALVALPIFSVLLIAAPSIFSLVFGEEWRRAGVYAQILSPWLYLNFIYSPVSQIPLLVNKQRQNLYIGVTYNLLILLFIFIGYFLKDILIGFYLISIFMTLFLAVTMIWLVRISKGEKLYPESGEQIISEIQ